MPAGGDTGPGRTATWAVAAGALVSAVLVLYATRRAGSPPLLQVLFAGWVVAPFALLAAGLTLAPRWPAPVRATLSTVAVVVAAASVIGYAAGAFGSSRPRAPLFVLIPPITSVVAMIAVMAAALRTRRR